MKIALKVGGSVFCPGESPDMGFVSRLADTLRGLASEHSMAVVVGGGGLARRMISDARTKGEASGDVLHNLGIDASRKNAQALIKALGDQAFPGIPKNAEGVANALKSGKIVVLGGFRPGQTTDAVTLQCAKAAGADMVVIGTDVKGVYDRDPKKDKNAKFISMISVSEIKELVHTDSVAPGVKTVIDPVAVEVIGRTGVTTIVLDIRRLDNLLDAIDGRDFEGTVIR